MKKAMGDGDTYALSPVRARGASRACLLPMSAYTVRLQYGSIRCCCAVRLRTAGYSKLKIGKVCMSATSFWSKCNVSGITHKGEEFLKFVGPGLLVTVGFIDPGNWAANLAAGAEYGYSLLWMVSLSTFMLIVLQHNAAHLGIVTGKCLSEAPRP